MKYSFELPRYRRANVWLDEAPPADFTASSVLTRIVKPKVVIGVQRRIVAIELSLAGSAASSYAFLGAEVVDSDMNDPEVIVHINPIGVPFAPSLALKSDEVRLGLIDEYAPAVIAGAERAADLVGLPTNVALSFRWAAHGLVGSSRSIFEKVSALSFSFLLVQKGSRKSRS